jgi:hypothetical protein
MGTAKPGQMLGVEPRCHRAADVWRLGVQNLAVVVRQVVDFSDYFDHGELHPGYEAADFINERTDGFGGELDDRIDESRD